MTSTHAHPDLLGNRYLGLREPTDVLLVERLLTTLGAGPDLETVTQVINRSRADLAGAPPGALPELLERLVRQRLR
ncbi:MAG TPA: hypothetical protein VGN18_04325 [Jatrophihabitans sp.]|jgi:hypothetical protein|uniref:hypothetical protein n=1 Tax=Jatrophihabitans sp. TaxID=1932789 RepID=UPI002E0A59DD|nr:hypothetical protein [Jatrophihabitans sp.]